MIATSPTPYGYGPVAVPALRFAPTVRLVWMVHLPLPTAPTVQTTVLYRFWFRLLPFGLPVTRVVRCHWVWLRYTHGSRGLTRLAYYPGYAPPASLRYNSLIRSNAVLPVDATLFWLPVTTLPLPD